MSRAHLDSFAPDGRSRAVLRHSTRIIASRARQSQWEAAISALVGITDQDIEADSIVYCAALGALERTARWETALALVQRMQRSAVEIYDHGLNYVALTCKKAGEWQRLLRLLVSPFRGVEHPAHEVAFTAGLEACRTRWAQGLSLLRCLANLRAAPDATTLSAAVAGLRQAAEWQHALGQSVWNSLEVCEGACALCILEPMLRCFEGLMRECFQRGPEPDAALCNAVATACEARQAGPLRSRSDKLGLRT
ncbi:unnamed protein product [Symbiodinium sp. CCMP2592]|nr:unnamed protein product [Symbiodinium sp. CCMP2592]